MCIIQTSYIKSMCHSFSLWPPTTCCIILGDRKNNTFDSTCIERQAGEGQWHTYHRELLFIVKEFQLEKEKYTKEKWAKAIYKGAIYIYFYKHVIHRGNAGGL